MRAGRRRIYEVLVTRNPASYGSELEILSSSVNCELRSVSEAEIARLSGSAHHQGIAARVDPYPYTDLTETLERARSMSGCLMMLDQIQDPFNVGSIIRTCECLGALGVVITKNNTCGITPAVEKTSAGASAYISVSRLANLTTAIECAKKVGFWIYGMDAKARADIYSMDLAPLAAFVLGGEGKGMRRLVREHCDEIVSIPLCGKVTSLNVSHTAAIALSEYRRRVPTQTANENCNRQE